MSWIDVHTHLNMLELPTNEALALAKKVGVENCITIGTSPDDWDLVSAIAEDNFPQVGCFIGLHPHDAAMWNAETENKLQAAITHPWVLGVGEIGLDYFYKNADLEVQKQVFRRQLEIAAHAQLPVQVHTRDADDDTIAILQEFGGQVTGLIHCFSGTQALADAAVKLGFHFSISGIVTFKNAESLRQVVKSIPLQHIHVETDAPFLAPVPMRGKKNQPAYMIHTAEFLAQLYGVPLADLQAQALINARQIFRRWKI